MNLLPRYLRKTFDGPRYEVVAYKTREDAMADRSRCARWPWHHSSRPTCATKVVVLNCYKWQVVWLPPLKEY